MPTKAKISKQSWTAFWKKLDVNIGPNSRLKREYSWVKYRKRFIRKGIRDDVADRIPQVFSSYRESDLQILRFSEFFLKDSDTVVRYSCKPSLTEALSKLLNVFKYSSFEALKKNLYKILSIRLLNKRGEGYEFISSLKSSAHVKDLKSRNLQTLLSKVVRERFKIINKFTHDGWYVIALKKDKPIVVYKFLQLKKVKGKILAKVAMNSKKEVGAIRYCLTKDFKSYFDSFEGTSDFNKFKKFIREGSSKHFALSGMTTYLEEFEVSVYPKFSKYRTDINLTSCSFYISNKPKLDSLKSVLITDKGSSNKRFSVMLQSHDNAGILGAILFAFNDKRLNSSERKNIKNNFTEDFGLILNSFVKHDIFEEKDFCRFFLENTGKNKIVSKHIRSQIGWEVLRKIEKLKLIEKRDEGVLVNKFCFNSQCRLGYKPQPVQLNYCSECKSQLHGKKEIFFNKLDERKIAELIKSKAKAKGYSVDHARKKLLNREINLVEVRHDQDKILYLPITKELTNTQLELLSLRFPEVCVLTSKGDVSRFNSLNIFAINLHEFVFSVVFKEENVLMRNTRTIKTRSRARVELLSADVETRIITDTFYEQKNVEFKNLGAEFFEADCSVLLKYIFGNSLWLGTKEKGRKVPDGISVFPVFKDIQKGVFIWDSKYSSKPSFSVGKVPKNRHYVESVKRNTSVKNKGGLKSFIFISNKPTNASFKSKAQKIIKHRNVKICALSPLQLVSIFQHYKLYKVVIDNSIGAKKAFYDFFGNILFERNMRSGGRVFILTDELLQEKLSENATVLAQIQEAEGITVDH